MTKHEKNTEPLTTLDMAVELVHTPTGRSRSIAVPPRLTHDEAVAWATKWLGTNERIHQFLIFR